MRKTTFIEIVVFLNICLFLYAATSKIMEFSVFREQLADSPLLKPFAGLLAWSLPAVELAVVMLLIVPRWRLKGLYSFLGLMILFVFYIVGMLSFSDHLPCSCGGLLQQMSWKAHVVFNSVFIILTWIAIRLSKQLSKDIHHTIGSTFA